MSSETYNPEEVLDFERLKYDEQYWKSVFAQSLNDPELFKEIKEVVKANRPPFLEFDNFVAHEQETLDEVTREPHIYDPSEFDSDISSN